ncbi:MAG TPA: carbohydrate kinase family protein [Pseudonocardiaceae bacterium]|jgi:sugar/nucleoside kinase (ribokinase family)|nr:carbohydrate kinase family protein [Pseudonocardiaceae bacterium]
MTVRALVLVVGDANPDLVLRGDVVPRFGQAEQLLDDVALLVGGSAAIAAHGFARLDRPVALLAAVGDDAFADPLLAQLASAGVRLDHVVRRAGQRTGLTVVLSTADDRAILTHLGTIPTLTADEVHDAVGLLEPAHMHVASFFLQPSLALALPELLGGFHGTVSLDTNDDPAGRWQGVVEVLPHVDVLLPNRREALALTGAPDLETAARKLAAHGPLVVVKDGGAGALACSPDGTLTSVGGTAQREPVDTTGAGDTFDAAFLDGWLDGLPLRHCLARAVQAGTAAVGAVGGTAGQPTARDLS